MQRCIFALLSLALFAAGVNLAAAQGFGYSWTGGGGAAQPPATQAPVNIVAPSIDATNLTNGTAGPVTISNGTWSSCASCTYHYQWYQQTPGLPAAGTITQTPIAGATSASYTPTSSGQLLYASVSATNTAGTSYSILAQPVGPVPPSSAGVPVNTTLPTVPSSGNYAAGGLFLGTSGGAWTNLTTGYTKYTYQWYDSSSSTCTAPTPISGATNSTYIPQSTDEGGYVCVGVIAYNSSGASAEAISNPGSIIPASTALPSAGPSWSGVAISGVAQVGQILGLPGATTLCNTFDNYFSGGGTGLSPPGVNFPTQSLCSFQWYDWNGTTLTPIAGATNYFYTVQTSDVGFQIEAAACGVNSFGYGCLTPTAPTATVTAPPGIPVNSVADTLQISVGGSPCTTTSSWIVGCTLKVILGTWSNSPAIYNYQWLRGGVAISGATGSTYKLAAADQAANISLQVIADNDLGPSTVETTAAVGPVVETGVPVNSAIPTITGQPVQGGLLTAGNGTWTLSPTSYSYQWLRNGVNITGATSQTYTLVSADVGNPITVSVVATNSVGSGSAAVSNPTTNVTNPGGLASGCTASISGTTEASQNLTATLSGAGCTGLTYTYAWTSSGTPVGSSSATYTLQESDVGNTLTVAITPTNGVGTSPPFTSSPTATITNPPAPSGGTVTAVTTAPLVSQPATWSTSGWSGAITYTYETCVGTWNNTTQVCTGTLMGWPGETYVPTSSDVGKNLNYIVIATNLGGSTSAFATAPSTVANPAVSTNTTAPVIIGTAEVGNLLVSSGGFWSGVQTQITFKWCSSGVAHTSECATGYGPISGAVFQTYTLQTSDQGNTIEAAVTAVNPGGNATVYTAPTAAVAAFPTVAGGCNGWASSTFYDGCAHAPPSGPYTVQHANFFSGYAQRGGQTYPSTFGCKGNPNCHPPWAVAGVDYPVGPSCGSSCGYASPGTATDPTSASANYGVGNPGLCAQGTATASNWLAWWSGGNAYFALNNNTYSYIGGSVTFTGFSNTGFNGTYINPPIPPAANPPHPPASSEQLYSTSTTASAPFTTSSTTISLSSISNAASTWLPFMVASDQVNIYDSTTGLEVGTVYGVSGKTVTLTSTAANVGSSGDTLIISQVFTVPMAVSPGSGIATGGVSSVKLNAIYCSSTTGSTIDIGPLDFSWQGNPYGQGLSLQIGGPTGECIIHDSYFVLDTLQTQLSQQLVAMGFANCAAIVFRNNIIAVRDPSGTQTPSFPAAWGQQIYYDISVTQGTGNYVQQLYAPLIMEDNAFINCPSRCVGFEGAFSSRFNYFDGLAAYPTTPNKLTVWGDYYAAHGDGFFSSLYNGPTGQKAPCYCTGGSFISERFDTWQTAPSIGTTTLSAGTIDCTVCALINVPEGTMYGWTTGDGIFHATSIVDSYGDYPGVRSPLNTTETMVSQCADFSGNVGCSLSQAESCSPATPCSYTLTTTIPACPSSSTYTPGQVCALTYVFPATFNLADERNSVWVNSPNNANGSGGEGTQGFPNGQSGTNFTFGYGDYNNVVIKNNYVDPCGIGQQAVQGQWNTGFPYNNCVAAPVPTLASGAVPSTSIGTGRDGNGPLGFGAYSYSLNAPVTGDNVYMTNGACYNVNGTYNPAGFGPSPLTECATTAPP